MTLADRTPVSPLPAASATGRMDRPGLQAPYATLAQASSAVVLIEILPSGQGPGKA